MPYAGLAQQAQSPASVAFVAFYTFNRLLSPTDTSNDVKIAMAEVFGTAASALAVIELAAKILQLCAQYSKDVAGARADIRRIESVVTDLEIIAKSTQQLIEGPHGDKLRTTKKLEAALQGGHVQLMILRQNLTPSTMRRLGLRAWKWPFQAKDVEKTITTLRTCCQTISFALQVDQM